MGRARARVSELLKRVRAHVKLVVANQQIIIFGEGSAGHENRFRALFNDDEGSSTSAEKQPRTTSAAARLMRPGRVKQLETTYVFTSCRLKLPLRNRLVYHWPQSMRR